VRTASLIAALLAAGVAQAQPKAPDWPCAQRKVQHLSIGQMWAGPIPDDLSAWRDDPDTAETAAAMAARRTPLREVEAMAASFATKAPDRAARLATLYAGVFALIDRERSRIVDGVTRFARRQQALSARIDAAQVALAEAQAAAAPDDFDALDRVEAMRDALAWDVRIFEERQRSLTHVCESPVILEQRAFAIGRLLHAEIGGG